MSESLAARVERYQPLVIGEMRAVVGDDAAELFAWMRYHLGWEDAQGRPAHESPGKMLRSTAVLLAAEMGGASAESVAAAGAAVDLVHNFSLLHDDIEDHSDARRGRPTVWTVAGIPQAINAGDAMFTLAHVAMHRLLYTGNDERRVVEAMRELDEACLRLVHGQYLDMAFETRDDVSTGEYVTMTLGKTAAMFEAPFAMGALLGGADAPTVAALRSFGGHVGLAFQALDDLLDCWGTAEALGKEPGGDLLSRKKTYPVLAALSTRNAALTDAYMRPPTADEDYRALAKLVEEAGGRIAAEAWADEQIAAARKALDSAQLDDAARAVLEEYLGTALGRAGGTAGAVA